MMGLQSRRTLIYVTLSLMTACWIMGLSQALLPNAGPHPLVTIGVLTLLVLVSLGLSRWVRSLGLKGNVRRGVLGGAFVFLALLVVSSGFYNRYGVLDLKWMDRMVQNELSGGTFANQTTSLVLVTLCWWMGITLGDIRLIHTNLVRYFYICILILILPAIFFVSDVSQDLPWLYFLFLFAGLVTLGLGRVEETARRSQDQGSPFTTYWLGQLGLTAGVLLALTGLAQASGIIHGLGIILALIAPVLAFLAYPLMFVGARILSLALAGAVEPGDAALETPDPGVAGPAVSSAYDPNNAQYLCVGLIVFVFLFGIFLAMVYGARRWRQMVKDHEKPEKAALPSPGDRVSDAFTKRLERARLNLPGLGRLRKRMAARSIRRIYAALTALSAEQGYPRAAARTPYEFLGALRQAFPGCEAQVAQITEAYVAAHYGQVPETREALHEIKAAWEQVREAAQRATPLPAPGGLGVGGSGRV